ncbi:oligopeptidase A, putative [Entamoeba dispar SAW760]|uniref:oligopeptidase A n=1 Tax=Entamoeba dispar (strain ATCC PRA-260 / SAW760) TaxID=370354 RepID=B0E960_ENTDS|nr:oligopeptidase A, putative [Entamoeba dispar SAW760]EDR28934.1 oligopeptidase A, putative [Entamoeba dispar SAW760]|eukprot:EDR28934.1 oligopeptidase A, putative [Entamoeba dispar SAW760]
MLLIIEVFICCVVAQLCNTNTCTERTEKVNNKTTKMEHPFLDQTVPINFTKLKPEYAVNDINEAIRQCQEQINQIKNIKIEEASFENVVRAFDNATIILDDSMLKLEVLVSCRSDIDEYRKAHEEVLPKVTEFRATLHSDEIIFSLVKKVYENKENLDYDQKRLVEETYEDFIEGGANLNKEDKTKLVELKKEITQLTKDFSNNLVDAVDEYTMNVEDKNKLEGIPENIIDMYKKEAEDRKKEGYIITLQVPSYFPAIKYCKNEEIRKELFIQYNKLCSEGKFDNTKLIQEIIEKRQKYAELLGYHDFSDLVTKRRMVKNGTNAIEFINQLHDKVQSFFYKEEEELKEFKKEKCGNNQLEPWDVNYYIELMKQEKYNFNEEEFREYFTEESVFGGLFEIYKRLYGVSFKLNKEIKGWHDDVKYYEVIEKDGSIIGGVYFDLYPRKGKRSGAWEEMLRVSYENTNGTFIKPLGIVCTNITPPINGITRLNHDEVETIFHESGHLMHTLFTKQRYASLAGTNVAWDFVELPSQIMENWTFEREALDLFSQFGNVKPIPKELFDKMWKAKNYMSAYYTMRQLSFGKIDLEIHRNYLTSGLSLDDFIYQKEKDYKYHFNTKTLSIIRVFQHLFSHFTGYACGYYSYKWAESIDADAFEYFKENGIFNQSIANKFRTNILSMGNSKPADELYRNFRGRNPDFTALLRRAGLLEKK